MVLWASALVGLVAVLAWVLARRRDLRARQIIDLSPRLRVSDIPADIEDYLAARNAEEDSAVPGTDRRVVWAGKPGAKTDLAIVYLHGFSASSEEIRPVPDLAAEALGANLFYARLAGHGRPGKALGRVTSRDWIDDTAEALEIGRRIGGRVLVIATSTGGTLAAEAMVQPAMAAGVAGVVFLSPNFGLRADGANLKHPPSAAVTGSWRGGARVRIRPTSRDHARFWTLDYPLKAVVPVAALGEHAAWLDYSGVRVPALFLYCEADQVVSPARTLAVARRWGAPVTVVPVTLAAGDDPLAHILAGRVKSPGHTDLVARTIIDWARGL